MVETMPPAAPESEQPVRFYRQILLIRRCEDGVAVCYQRRTIGGFFISASAMRHWPWGRSTICKRGTVGRLTTAS